MAYYVRNQSFDSEREARSYARVASTMYGTSVFNIVHKGRVLATYYQGKAHKELVLWGRRPDEPEHEERIITAQTDQIERASVWAEKQGYTRQRIQIVNLNTAPNFRRAVTV